MTKKDKLAIYQNDNGEIKVNFDENQETFLGLDSTGWTSLSAIAIFLSVLASLFISICLEPLKNSFKKKRILKVLESNLDKNIEILKKIKEFDLYEITRNQKEEEQEKLKKFVYSINFESWELNKSFLSITSPQEFDKYNNIHIKLSNIKNEFCELENINRYWYTKNVEKIISKFNYTKNNIKKFLEEYE
ncbi:hypothetical protein [Candidatus Absconditicoccus praedator]|uniref:hypothetical protein n=1 Tax=Candidatus Absconditicoccus praedator TaxID=2735562 RepID=UPI001E43AA92|nr:hypothetical protein [Candidatus Absconditicoccus praedator]UFX82624.1 hypothetical protein HLG78_00525 [Candidatus Absconditicoccus praedator]